MARRGIEPQAECLATPKLFYCQHLAVFMDLRYTMGAGTATAAKGVQPMLEARDKYFRPDMTVAEAMAIHPRVAEVFAAFHLGGCSHCGISQVENVDQVCAAYGVDINVLLEVLEGLMEKEAVKADESVVTETKAAG